MRPAELGGAGPGSQQSPAPDTCSHHANDRYSTEHSSAVDDVMSVDEAREITERILQSLENLWELVVAAYHGRVWLALDYKSWDHYCDTEFGGNRLRLPREERADVVCSLREAGLSIRAIASATGASVGSVHDAITCSEMNTSNGNGTQDQTITGLDGKSQPARKRRRITRAIQDKFVKRFDQEMVEMRRSARAIQRMCITKNWIFAAPHAELRIVLKLLNQVQEIIERVLETPEQTTIFDTGVTE